MNNQSKGGIITGAAAVLLNAGLLVGMITVFHACGAKEDGSWMTCHYAERMIEAIAAVQTIVSLIPFVIRKNGAAAAISLALIPGTVLMMLIPNVLIPLCMMPDMRCRMIMRTAALVFGILILAAAAANAVISMKKKK